MRPTRASADGSFRARRGWCALFVSACIAVACWCAPSAWGGAIGIDNAHGYNYVYLASSGTYNSFRSIITGLGHTIVPLTSFGASDLAGLDAVILATPYTTDAHDYSASERAAVQSAVGAHAVFVSDGSLWGNDGAGSDHPIGSNDNAQLLTNIINYITGQPGLGLLTVAESGTDALITSMNAMVAPFGIRYATVPVDGQGHVVSGFVTHPVTAGIANVGVDYQLPITTTSPSLDLTIGTGHDNILSVLVPEPAGLSLLAIGGLAAWRRRR